MQVRDNTSPRGRDLGPGRAFPLSFIRSIGVSPVDYIAPVRGAASRNAAIWREVSNMENYRVLRRAA